MSRTLFISGNSCLGMFHHLSVTLHYMKCIFMRMIKSQHLATSQCPAETTLFRTLRVIITFKKKRRYAARWNYFYDSSFFQHVFPFSLENFTTHKEADTVHALLLEFQSWLQKTCSNILLNIMLYIYVLSAGRKQHLLSYSNPVDPTRATFRMVIVEFSVDKTATEIF